MNNATTTIKCNKFSSTFCSAYKFAFFCTKMGGGNSPQQQERGTKYCALPNIKGSFLEENRIHISCMSMTNHIKSVHYI